MITYAEVDEILEFHMNMIKVFKAIFNMIQLYHAILEWPWGGPGAAAARAREQPRVRGQLRGFLILTVKYMITGFRCRQLADSWRLADAFLGPGRPTHVPTTCVQCT